MKETKTKSTIDKSSVNDINFTAVQTIIYRVLEDFDKIAMHLRTWESLNEGKEIHIDSIIKELINAGFENMCIAFYVMVMTSEIQKRRES